MIILKKTYLTQIQTTYTDHLHKPINYSNDLPQTYHPKYTKQHKYFYNTKKIHKNLQNIIKNKKQKFNTLKIDLYNKIYNTYTSNYTNKLLHIQTTLSQTTNFPLSNSIITQFPSIIKTTKKKKLYHILINNHILK